LEIKRAHALRIGMIAPPFLPVPPPRYGGTERIVGVLAEGLQRRGHHVTVFGSGDSRVSTNLVPTVPVALWGAGEVGEAAAAIDRTLTLVAEHAGDFDLIHNHLEWHGFPLARTAPVPVVATLHGRIDIGPTAEALPLYPEIPLIAISDKQRSFWPDQNWLATVHHGLPFDDTELGDGEGGYLLFVGRLTPEKGVDHAIELARRTGLPLFVAAKALDEKEVAHYHEVVEPAERAGLVRFLGEVGPPARDRLFGDAAATVMLGDWPEPFGLVAVESLATGTPLIAKRAGALPEIVRDGIDGFIVADVDDAVAAVAELGALDRSRVRSDALSRFSVERMVSEYESVFRQLLADKKPESGSPEGLPKRDRAALGVP
jgi:glycosyltransferase involved in cell wall biosynthesis